MHNVHDVAPPGSIENVPPKMQDKHSPLGPLVDEPAGQSEHDGAPDAENQPGRQGVHERTEPLITDCAKF